MADTDTGDPKQPLSATGESLEAVAAEVDPEDNAPPPAAEPVAPPSDPDAQADGEVVVADNSPAQAEAATSDAASLEDVDELEPEPGAPDPDATEPGEALFPPTEEASAVLAQEVADPSAVLSSLVRIERRIDEVARLAERNADHVSSLHAENQRLRTGELAKATAPLIRDVVRVHDDVLRLEGAAPAEAVSELKIVRNMLVSTLSRWGVTTFEPAEGDAFNAAEHNGLGRVETSDPFDGRIAIVRRCGFRNDDGRVWRPADVDVYRHVSAPAGEPAIQEE